MCLKIPLQVKEVKNNNLVVEDGRSFIFDPKLKKVSQGDYVLVFGDLVVDLLPEKEGKKINAFFKNLSK